MKAVPTKTRAIRLTEIENKEIENFLRANPIFDFSTLTRTALNQFIRNPHIDLKPLKAKGGREDNLAR